ncbi:unnamed protein product [Rotaria sp. Silwood2]|nr:unnamed protein product [Rotaria sp. Silwood2]CAF4307598.1 unnamed protein product [Rotaria sp. Silwood2]
MSLDMIENENINDNDILTSLNDLITDIISHDPIQSENDTSQNEKISNNEACCSSTYSPINRLPCIKISLLGIQFITDWELKSIDAQRLLLKDNVWLPNGSIDLIKLKQLNLSEPIVRWLSAANKKELYWSGESRGDWLISVQKWLWKKQLEELKDVTYITIIADETCNNTVIEQFCICLRYFNPSTGELVERIVYLCEIYSQTGEVFVVIFAS